MAVYYTPEKIPGVQNDRIALSQKIQGVQGHPLAPPRSRSYCLRSSTDLT